MLLTLRRVIAGAVLAAMALALAPRAWAQEPPAEFDSWRVPGWSFTPGITFGGLYDSNVALAPPDVSKKTAADKLFEMQPSGQLEFFGPRTSFSSGYRGLLRRYVTLSGLDDSDQRGYVNLRERFTRRLTLFLVENYAQVATTDQLQLNGVPFQRTGGRYNSFDGGIEARLTRTLELTSRYEMTWVDFVRKQNVALTGGVVNGAAAELTHRFNERASLGGEYDVRLASLDAGRHQLVFQEAGGVFHYRATQHLLLDLSSGAAHLTDRSNGITRSGPYVKAGVTERFERATIGATYHRSYVPSLVFGGTNQSQEATAYLQMPLSRNRWYLQESAAWRRTDPFLASELPLSSTWVNNLIGYEIRRWFRIEGYYAFTTQDNRQAAGHVTRHVAGTQIALAKPMRIR